MQHNLFFNAQKLQRNVHLIPQSLGLNSIPVHIEGTQFYCVGNFTLRKLLKTWCDWSKKNPQSIPTLANIQNWCQSINRPFLIQEHNSSEAIARRRINIPSIPSEITHRTSLAYMGGLLHESAHLLYTYQQNLKPSEIKILVDQYWNAIANWGIFEKALLLINNLLEDIRIERMLRRNYLNMLVPLSDLQDLILEWEGIKDKEQWVQNSTKSGTLLACFRDLGLGYQTRLGDQALEMYQEHYPEIWKECTTGRLKSILQNAIAIERPLEHFTLTLELMIAIKNMMLPQSHKEPASRSKQRSSQSTPTQTEVQNLDSSPKGHKSEQRNTKDQRSQSDSKAPKKNNDTESENVSPSSTPDVHFWAKTGLELIRNPHPHRGEQVQEITQKEIQQVLKELPSGERRWYPMNTSMDQIIRAANSKNKSEYNQIFLSNKSHISKLQSPLKRLLLGFEQSTMVHGSKTGQSLSPRKYSSSWASIQNGTIPTHPYQQRSTSIQFSMSASIIIDQSGSMKNNIRDLKHGVIVLANALHNIHARMEILGFNTPIHYSQSLDFSNIYHRNEPVQIIRYLDYGQNFIHHKERLLSINSNGSTPTSDAIQQALSNISKERSTHRFIIVLTDGFPNNRHQAVINRQMRLAKSMGIMMIGVGLGTGTQNVVKQFPYSIYCPQIEDFAPKLITCITEMLREKHPQMRR